MVHHLDKEAASMHTRPSCVSRIRKVPTQCRGVDQRLVRDRDLAQLSHEACALALFRLTVADAHGLRFSADRALCRRLSMAHAVLPRARQELIPCDGVASAAPLDQVLALDPPPRGLAPGAPRMTAADTPMAIKDLFNHLAETLS
jgi:hypothetical protein